MLFRSHSSLQEQVNHLNQMLRGHYAYYGIAGNLRALQRVHRAVERYWRKMLSSRSCDGVIRWEQFQRIKEQFPLLRPGDRSSYRFLDFNRLLVAQPRPDAVGARDHMLSRIAGLQ